MKVATSSLPNPKPWKCTQVATGKGKISPGDNFAGDNFATLEIPKAPSKHVSRKMSLNFRKKIFCLSVSICPLRT